MFSSYFLCEFREYILILVIPCELAEYQVYTLPRVTRVRVTLSVIRGWVTLRVNELYPSHESKSCFISELTQSELLWLVSYDSTSYSITGTWSVGSSQVTLVARTRIQVTLLARTQNQITLVARARTQVTRVARAQSQAGLAWFKSSYLKLI